MATRTPTYYTGTITGQAGTLITVLDAILVTGEGWTKTYSGTNKAVYTQASGNGFCFRVLDDGSGAGSTREAEVRAAESASDVDTLVDPFPTVAQVSNANCTWRKSNTTDATTRNYWCVADGNCFHLIINFDGSTASDMYSFGDTEPHYTGDGYNTFMTTRVASNSNSNSLIQTNIQNVITGSGFTCRVFFARSADGLVKSDYGYWVGAGQNIGNNGFGNPTYPSTPTNKMHLTFINSASAYSNSTTASQAGAMLRGVIPHVLEPLLGNNTGTLANADTFQDSSYDATADSLVLLAIEAGTFSTSAKIVFQKDGTWDPGF